MSFTESEKSYFHYKFRLVVMEHLKGGKIFGGTVREILKSAACLKEELADKSKFPRSFFVDPDTDIDVFYTDPDRMQEDLVALQTKFFIASSTEKRLSTYGMCLVKSIVLRPSAFSVFGRDGLQIKLDFVEKKDDLSQLFECLSCNNLQTVGTSGIFQLFRPFSHQQSADDFLELIDAMNASMFRMKETRWLLLRHDFFDQMSMLTHCNTMSENLEVVSKSNLPLAMACYGAYLRGQLFRVQHMLFKGWRITNLCDGITLRVDDSCTVYAKSSCCEEWAHVQFPDSFHFSPAWHEYGRLALDSMSMSDDGLPINCGLYLQCTTCLNFNMFFSDFAEKSYRV